MPADPGFWWFMAPVLVMAAGFVYLLLYNLWAISMNKIDEWKALWFRRELRRLMLRYCHERQGIYGLVLSVDRGKPNSGVNMAQLDDIEIIADFHPVDPQNEVKTFQLRIEWDDDTHVLIQLTKGANRTEVSYAFYSLSCLILEQDDDAISNGNREKSDGG